MEFLEKFYIGIHRIFLHFGYSLESILNLLLAVLELFIRPFFDVKGDFRILLIEFRDYILDKLLEYNQYINEIECNFHNDRAIRE